MMEEKYTFTPTRYVLLSFNVSLMTLIPSTDPLISMATQSLSPATGSFFRNVGVSVGLCH